LPYPVTKIKWLTQIWWFGCCGGGRIVTGYGICGGLVVVVGHEVLYFVFAKQQ